MKMQTTEASRNLHPIAVKLRRNWRQRKVLSPARAPLWSFQKLCRSSGSCYRAAGEGGADRWVLTAAHEPFMGCISVRPMWSGVFKAAFPKAITSTRLSDTGMFTWGRHVCSSPSGTWAAASLCFIVQKPTSSISGAAVVLTAGNHSQDGWGFLSAVAFHFDSEQANAKAKWPLLSQRLAHSLFCVCGREAVQPLGRDGRK